MQINERATDGLTVIALQGDLDAAAAPSVEGQLQALIKEGQTRLVVDLNGVAYIASAGLRVLLAALKAARNSGGDLRLVGLQPAVKEVFDMAGFTRLFKVYADVETAVASF
jgi:anti-sigma B factor antagonist